MVVVSYTYEIQGADIVEERWKEIEGFYGYYLISDFGRIKSIGGWCGSAKRKEKIRSTSLTKDGYIKVRLNKKDKDKTARVHRLVAEAFIPNLENKDTVHHKDGNKQNNHFSNLEWFDRSEQMYHAYDLQLKKSQTGIENKNSKLTSDDIKEIRKLYVRQSKEYGTVALAKKYGVTDSVIGLIIRNKSYKKVK